MLMEILAIDQDCLISYLNLYFDEIAEIIRFLLLSAFYLSHLFKILDNSTENSIVFDILNSHFVLGDLVSYRSRNPSY